MPSKHNVMFRITSTFQNKHVIKAPVDGTLTCVSVLVVFKVCQSLCRIQEKLQ